MVVEPIALVCFKDHNVRLLFSLPEPWMIRVMGSTIMTKEVKFNIDRLKAMCPLIFKIWNPSMTTFVIFLAPIWRMMKSLATRMLVREGDTRTRDWSEKDVPSLKGFKDWMLWILKNEFWLTLMFKEWKKIWKRSNRLNGLQRLVGPKFRGSIPR